MARGGYTAILRQIFYTVNVFRVQVENGLENVLFLHFRWFQSSLTYHDSCGPHWRLHSYSSHAGI